MKTTKRKSEHIRIALNEDVRFRNKTTGFENYELVHCALPEINLQDVSTETEFLGKTLSFPLMIGGMTGGCSNAVEINRQLAVACQEMRIALGVGSQRQMLEDDRHLNSFRVVREVAPDAVIIGNIGAEQVAQMEDLSVYQRMIDLIEADGMAVHLNPLQEALQKEGNARFRDVLKGIEFMVRGLNVPIIVKEVGCGISEHVARILKDVGVKYVDIAGAGGTSWAAIESFREADKRLARRFRDWGIPTARSLEMVSRVSDLHIIASGGIENGVIMAKAFGLGAEMCGAALPFLKVLLEEKTEGLLAMLKLWREELRLAMFLTGSRITDDLRREGVIEKWNLTKES